MNFKKSRVHEHRGNLAEMLSIHLEVEQEEFGAEDAVNVRFIVTNHHHTTVHLLTWDTPLEGFFNDILMVTQEGEPVDYLGYVAKRGRPEPEDYIAVEAGDSVSIVFDIAEVYAVYIVSMLRSRTGTVPSTF